MDVKEKGREGKRREEKGREREEKETGSSRRRRSSRGPFGQVRLSPAPALFLSLLSGVAARRRHLTASDGRGTRSDISRNIHCDLRSSSDIFFRHLLPTTSSGVFLCRDRIDHSQLPCRLVHLTWILVVVDLHIRVRMNSQSRRRAGKMNEC